LILEHTPTHRDVRLAVIHHRFVIHLRSTTPQGLEEMILDVATVASAPAGRP